MISRDVQVINKLGIHARAAARLIDLARTFACDVRIGRTADALVDAKSIMKVLRLEASVGTDVVIATDGEDEQAALDAVCGLIADRFGEAE